MHEDLTESLLSRPKWEEAVLMPFLHMRPDVGVQLLTKYARNGLAHRIQQSNRSKVFWLVARLVRLLEEGEPRIGPMGRDIGLMLSPLLKQAAIKKLTYGFSH